MHDPDTRHQWVSVKQAAIHFGTSESDIRRKIKRGELLSESIARPGGTLLRVRLPEPEDTPAPHQPPPDTRQDAPEAAQGAVTALTDMLADEREERQRLAAENRTLAERAAAAEADARHLAERLTDERERRLAAEQERDRLRQRSLWRPWTW